MPYEQRICNVGKRLDARICCCSACRDARPAYRLANGCGDRRQRYSAHGFSDHRIRPTYGESNQRVEYSCGSAPRQSGPKPNRRACVRHGQSISGYQCHQPVGGRWPWSTPIRNRFDRGVGQRCDGDRAQHRNNNRHQRLGRAGSQHRRDCRVFGQRNHVQRKRKIALTARAGSGSSFVPNRRRMGSVFLTIFAGQEPHPHVRCLTTPNSPSDLHRHWT